jgi:hypothetical protein
MAGSAITIETESMIEWYRYLPFNIVLGEQLL